MLIMIRIYLPASLVVHLEVNVQLTGLSRDTVPLTTAVSTTHCSSPTPHGGDVRFSNEPFFGIESFKESTEQVQGPQLISIVRLARPFDAL